MRTSPPPVVMSGRELAYLSRIHSAREAVMAAADNAPGGYLGRVAFSVRAVGWDAGRLFLNSEEDYRDPRNLSVVVSPHIAKEVLTLLGGNEDSALQRKAVIVTGQFRRTRIEFLERERPTGKYYFQTHLTLDNLKQMQIVDLKP